MPENPSFAQRALSRGATAFWTPEPSRFGVDAATGDWFRGVIQSMACQTIVNASRALEREA